MPIVYCPNCGHKINQGLEMAVTDDVLARFLDIWWQESEGKPTPMATLKEIGHRAGLFELMEIKTDKALTAKLNYMLKNLVHTYQIDGFAVKRDKIARCRENGYQEQRVYWLEPQEGALEVLGRGQGFSFRPVKRVTK